MDWLPRLHPGLSIHQEPSSHGTTQCSWPPAPADGRGHSCDPDAETRGEERLVGGCRKPGGDWAHADGQMTGRAGGAVCRGTCVCGTAKCFPGLTPGEVTGGA